MSKLQKFALGTTIAAAAGYVAGILTAPKSGRETRDDIKTATTKSLKEAERQLKQLHTDLDGLLGDAKERADDLSGRTRRELDALVDLAKDSKQKARDMLSALHEGDADDRDLKKAIHDATKALDHLRDYLAK